VEKRTKLYPSGEMGILVGYNEDSKAYRVFSIEQWRKVVSRDEPRAEASSAGSQIPEEVEE
jgi:hypothetical protein